MGASFSFVPPAPDALSIALQIQLDPSAV